LIIDRSLKLYRLFLCCSSNLISCSVFSTDFSLNDRVIGVDSLVMSSLTY